MRLSAGVAQHNLLCRRRREQYGRSATCRLLAVFHALLALGYTLVFLWQLLTAVVAAVGIE